MNQGFSPSGVPLENRSNNNTGGANLQSSTSFSRARNPDTVKPVERAGSATARLERQNTTITPSAGASLQKSNTIGSRPVAPPPREANGDGRRAAAASPPPANRSPRDGDVGPTRGLSIRRQDAPLPPPPGGGAGRGRGGPANGPNGAQNQRLTDIYDDYLDGYNEEPPLPDESNRVKAWASRTLPGAPAGPSRAVSQRVPPNGMSMYGDRSVYGGSAPSVRRRPTRQNTLGSRSRAPTQYGEEEEEGYGSGDYDGGFELVRIKVKIHYNGEVRGMALTPDVPYEEFVEKVASKFNKSYADIMMKFTDEDGMKVTLRDESDYDLAIETARESAKGKPDGKLVIWAE
jgi:neutrophil factor 2